MTKELSLTVLSFVQNMCGFCSSISYTRDQIKYTREQKHPVFLFQFVSLPHMKHMIKGIATCSQWPASWGATSSWVFLAVLATIILPSSFVSISSTPWTFVGDCLIPWVQDFSFLSFLKGKLGCWWLCIAPSVLVITVACLLAILPNFASCMPQGAITTSDWKDYC